MSKMLERLAGWTEVRKDFGRAELPILALCLLAVHLSTHAYNYLFFHSIAEFFSIFIAVTVFIIVINTADVVKNQYVLVVGVASLFIGIMDTFHALSYKGMPIFTDYDYYAPQFWVAARYLESLSMLGAFAFLGNRRPVSVPILAAGYAVVTAALVVSILVTKTFPVCFIKGLGLTAFKVASEYLICAILVIAIFMLFQRRDLFDRRVYRLLRLSMVLMILMELCFTLYVSDSMSDLVNELGHLLKICAYYLVYKAVVVTGLRDPIALLFRDLKEREQSLLEAQRLARLGHWEWHPTTGRWTWTAEISRFLGLPATVTPGLETLLAPLHPQEQALLRRALEQAAGEGLAFEMMLHLGQGVGEVRFAQLRGQALRRADGRIDRVIGTLLDVSVNQFSIEKAEESVVWLNGTGRLIYVNDAACRLLGYGRDELLRLSVGDINPERTQPVFEAHFADLKRTGSQRFEASLRRQGGNLVPVEICANHMFYAGDDYDIAFVRDMTQHKAAAAALAHANDIYAALSHTNQAIIHCKSRQELFDTVTEVAARYGRFRLAWIGLLDPTTLDIRPAAAAGDCRDYVHRLNISLAPGSPTGEGPMARCIRQGQPQIVNDFLNAPESTPWHQAGAPFGLKAAAAFPITNRGRTIGALTLYADTAGFFTPDLVDLLTEMAGDISFGLDRLDLLTENQRQDQELRAAVERLTESNSDLERFAYVAAHDLQEPVRNIVSFTQLLQRRVAASLQPEDQENCRTIVDSARRLSQLIKGLLAYSRVTAKELAFTPVDLGQACAAAIDNLREAIAESGTEVTVTALPTVAGDIVQLTQVLQNLIGNAIKFRQPDVPPKVRVSAERRDGEWLITVADNGIGIADTDQDIFELFRRLHPASEFPGSGMGLALSKRIVLRHNGRVWYDSAPGGGTAFHVALPAPEVANGDEAALITCP